MNVYTMAGLGDIFDLPLYIVCTTRYAVILAIPILVPALDRSVVEEGESLIRIGSTLH
jgi:hypothetical protein